MQTRKNLTDKAIRKCLSFGNIKRKTRIRNLTAVSGAGAASLGAVCLLCHCAYLIAGSMLGAHVSITTPFQEFSCISIVVGVVLFFVAVVMRDYGPISELPVNRCDHLRCLEKYLRDVPEVRQLRDAIVNSGRELCCRDYDVIQDLSLNLTELESKAAEPRRQLERANLAATLNQSKSPR